MRPRRLKNEINVVPYIDVMLVLLVIFMVTAPMMQTGVIDLPSVGQASQPKSLPLEVMVKADRSLALTDRANPNSSERALTLAELPAAPELNKARDLNQPVLVAGDKSVAYEAVLQVMDELQKARIQQIGLLVVPQSASLAAPNRAQSVQ